MPLKVSIVVSATVIASAVTAIPVEVPSMPGAIERGQPLASSASASPLARKGDRLRVLDVACATAAPSAECADLYGVAGAPPRTLTIERRIGEATTVLIRLPLSQMASR